MCKQRLVLASLLVLFTTMLSFSMPAQAVAIYVAPEGNDKWSGATAQPNAQGTDGPVATLERARDVLRQKKSAAGEERRVVVAEGRYQLAKAFVLTPEDSGVTYEAAPGAHPVFSGGKVISGFKAGTDGLWVRSRSGGCQRLVVLRPVVRQRLTAPRERGRPTSSTPTWDQPRKWPSKASPASSCTHDRPRRRHAPLQGLSEVEIRDVVLVA